MAKVLMTWELGAGYGHLAPLRTLAEALKARGHEVAVAARDMHAAATFFEGTGIAIHQAPANLSPRGKLTLLSFPQILLNTCFHDMADLEERVRAWRRLYRDLEPQLLVCDHSPTALLAAQGLDLPRLPIGYGFVVPPDVTPMPGLRPWLDVDAAVLARDEARALDMANQALEKLGAPALESLSALYRTPNQPLFTVEELDNYASTRRKVEYWGPLLAGSGKPPAWPPGPGKRVFVYLRPFPTLPSLLDSLREAGQSTILHIPRLAPDIHERYNGGSLRFSDGLLDIQAVARECDLAVLHGGHGTLALMLLGGKPLLLLPLHLEMLLNAEAAVKLGAALSAPLLRPEGMRQKLERLLGDSSWQAAAGRFAERHAGLELEGIPERFAALAESLIARGGSP